LDIKRKGRSKTPAELQARTVKNRKKVISIAQWIFRYRAEEELDDINWERWQDY